MRMKVRKAVFPAAGLGTRFLPATKAQPKEMLPLVDKPIIQYGVEEALAAGCDQIIIVTGRMTDAAKTRRRRRDMRLQDFLDCASQRQIGEADDSRECYGGLSRAGVRARRRWACAGVVRFED